MANLCILCPAHYYIAVVEQDFCPTNAQLECEQTDDFTVHWAGS